MDGIDRKIIAELDNNPRLPITQLAKRVRISQQVADYRLKRLLERGIIIKFGTIINLKALKQEHYRVFFTFNAKKEYKQEDIFNYLKQETGVYWAARIGGKYDLLVVLFVFDFAAFDNFIDSFNKEFPGLIKDYKSAYVVEHEIYKHKYIDNDGSYFNYGYNDQIENIDELDFYIINRIKDNCRLSALQISNDRKRVSYKTIINRIKSLEKRKIILGYRLFMKSDEYKPFIILLSFKNYSRTSEKELLRYLRSNERVTQIARLFGLWNLFIHIRMENYENLQNFLIELRDKFDIIDNYEIIPIFEDISINLAPIRLKE